MPFDPLTVGVLVAAVFILGLSKGGFAGIGMVSMPLFSLVVPPTVAAGILLPILMTQDAISVFAYRKTFDKSNLKILLPGSVIGIIFGAFMISRINPSTFELVLGIVSLGFGAERLLRYFSGPVLPHKPHRIVGAVCGVLAGFTSMVAHAGIPPFQFYVLPQRLPRDIFIGTSVFFYAATNLIKFPFFLSLGQITLQTFIVSLTMLPVALLSVLLGIRLVRRLSSDRYILVANILLIAIGAMLVLRGLEVI